jgi:hypothetical protein
MSVEMFRRVMFVGWLTVHAVPMSTKLAGAELVAPFQLPREAMRL